MEQRSHELRALFIAVTAAVLVLAVTLGGAALVRRTVSTADGVVAATPGPAASPASSTPAPSATRPPPVSAAVLQQGKTLFAANCASCHGDSGEGAYGPNLRRRARSTARVAALVTRGVSGKMPAYGGKLSPDAIQAVAAYVTQSLEPH